MKRLIELAAIILMTLPAAAQTAQNTAAPSQRLGDVKSVFVGSLGSAYGSDLIKEKVISRLVKLGAVQVTEDQNKADAMLTGASAVNAGYFNGNTSYSASSAVRLVGRDGSVLWTDETRSGRIIRRSLSVSSDVADKLARSLSKAVLADRQSAGQP